MAEKGDSVCREILSGAAVSLAELVASVVSRLGWRDRDIPLARIGGVYGRSKYFDAAIEAEINKSVPLVRNVVAETSPAEAAARMAARLSSAKGNAA